MIRLTSDIDVLPNEETPVDCFVDGRFRVHRKKGKVKLVPAPMLEGPVADTHTHLSMVDAPLVLARCAVHHVDFLCCITDVDEDSERVFACLDGWLAEAADVLQEIVRVEGLPETPSLPKVRLAVGVHPHNAKDYDDAMEAQLMRLAVDPRVCAIGEVGLDYHYDLSPRDSQREVFARQIRIAKQTGLKLVLHLREAHEEAFEILEREGADPRSTLLHCCSLSAEELKPWIERGYRIAYGGAITFANSVAAREALPGVPLDAMMTETDAPYMAPVPLRGTDCGPEYVIFTAARLAEELGYEPGEPRRRFLAQLHCNALAFMDGGATPWQISQA